MDALKALRTRRSIRKYTSQPVTRSQLRTIVDAGRLAASARNIQPWEFVVVTKRAVLDRVADISDYGKFLHEAPACILVFARTDAKYFLEDGAAATQNMLVAAHALGLGTCWIAGDKKPYAGEIAALVKVPKEYRLVSYIAVGHCARPAARPASKRSLRDVLHWETFGCKRT